MEAAGETVDKEDTDMLREAQYRKGGVGGFPWRRQVYVYLWGSSIGPGDVWGHWVTRLPRVTVNLLDVPRVRLGAGG